MVIQLRSHLTAGLRLLLVCVAAGVSLLCLWVLTAPGAGASTESRRAVGAVYTQTNDPVANSVVVFNRFANGTLRKRQTVRTGGRGSTQSVGCGPGCPILDSQTAVVVSNNGRFVFAVNAGSDTVTSFRETGRRLRRINQVSSGGDMPESLALHGNVLYVLNVATQNSNGTTGNIYGLRVSPRGRLSALGSSQPLASAAPPDHSADPRAIAFKPNGKVLVVTEFAGGFESGPPGRIDTFVVGSNGMAGPAVSHPSSDILPFGFAFDRHSHIVVSNIHDPVGTGTVSTYTVTNSGNLTPIETEASGGFLPCWIAVSNDNRFAYVVNTGAGPPSRVTHFGLSGNGNLTPLSPAAEHTGDFLQTDAALSRNSSFLYVLAPTGPNPAAPASHIDAWRRNSDGSLTFIGSTRANANLGAGASGLAAR